MRFVVPFGIFLVCFGYVTIAGIGYNVNIYFLKLISPSIIRHSGTCSGKLVSNYCTAKNLVLRHII